METSELKNKIASLKAFICWKTDEKVKATQERKEYKECSRGIVSESERNQWFLSKDGYRREIKSEIRAALLAYGFLRGRNYNEIEKHCKKSKSTYPSVSDIHIELSYLSIARGVEYISSKEEVEDWFLNGKPSPYRRSNG